MSRIILNIICFLPFHITILPKLHLALAADPRYERALVDYSYGEALNDVVKHSAMAEAA